MAKVICTELQKDGASGPNITLDTSKNVTCENNLQVDGNVTVTGTLPAAKLTGALPAISGASLTGISSQDTLSFRNIIINGAMNVAQRGTSSTDNSYATVDRFRTIRGNTDEAPTQAQVALTSSDTGPWEKGFRNCLKVTNGNQTNGAQATDSISIQQKVEAQNLAGSGWNYNSTSSYITLSFWCKSSVAQNFYGRLETPDGTAQNYPFETGSLSANTWTKITKTIPGNANITINNDTGTGMEVELSMFRGTDGTDSGVSLNTWAAYAGGTRTPDNTSTWYTTNDATFAITGVQLEVGDTATDFEHRGYQEELSRCQRYYYTLDEDTFAFHYRDDYKMAQVQFPQQMRANPTATATYYPTSGWTSYQANNTQITLYRAEDIGSSNTYVRDLVLSAEL